MEIKLFGKTIFEYKNGKVAHLLSEASSEATKSKYLPDFYRGFENNDWILPLSVASITTTTSSSDSTGATLIVEDKKKTTKREYTPKEVFTMKMLNDKSFKMKVEPDYVDKQIASFKDKLALISSEEYDMRRGVNEISSVLARMENRKKYPQFATFYEDFAYTTTERIEGLLKAHTNLQIGQVAQFLADMPVEAADTMKDYNSHTDLLCGKKAVFYIIADKKDFKKTEKRRDPILLAQSPFGHFWQILGAWDKEMLMLSEL